jgi:hypothetical protein
MASKFYSNQMESGDRIIEKFQAGINYSLLYAQTQSGKSGTFHYVAQRMLDLRMIDQVILICGSNEIALRNQAHEDAISFNKRYFTRGKFLICFRNGFKDELFDSARTLWIVDESHMDQDIGQSMDVFLQKHGINLEGSTPKMMKNETYILSVSATPYSEYSDICYRNSLPKHVEELAAGEGYFGITQYFEKDLIHPTFSIKEEWGRFAAFVLSRGKKYNIVRLHASKDEENSYNVIKRLAPAAGIQILYFTSERSDIAITRKEMHGDVRICMEDAPHMPTLIIVKGRLRAGKVVPKEHVGFVWEDSHDPKTDTIVQSLLGRMCGYKFGDKMPHVFIPPKMIEDSKSCIKDCPIKRSTLALFALPLSGRNMVAARQVNMEGRRTFPTVPLFISAATMRNECGGWDEASASEKANMVIAYLKANSRVIMRNPDYTEEQKAELIEYLKTAKGRYRSTQKEFLSQLKEAHKNHECWNGEVMSSDEFKIVVMTDDGNDAYCYIQLEAKSDSKKMALKARIPGTTKREIFHQRLANGLPEPFAATTLCLSEASADNAEIFVQQLEKIMGLWKDGEELPHAPFVNPCVSAIAGGAIRFSRKVYGGGKLELILAAIGRKYETEIKVKTVDKIESWNSATILIKEFSWD